MPADNLEELRSRARAQVWPIAKRSLYRLMDSAPDVWRGHESRFYRTEKALIIEHLSPIYWGGCVGVFLFVTFRVSGSRWFHRLRSQYLQRTCSSNKASPSMLPFQQQQQPWKSHLEQQAEAKQEIMAEAMRLPSDILLSLLCGISSVLWLWQPKKFQRDLVRAPLLPGKSLVHECACDDLLSVYESTDRRVLDGDATLQTVGALVDNCRIRSAYIEERRSDGDPRYDVVPYPGLKGVER